MVVSMTLKSITQWNIEKLMVKDISFSFCQPSNTALNWRCAQNALMRMEMLRYIFDLTLSYFSNWQLVCDNFDGTELYKVTASIHLGSLPRPVI